jgi:alkylhydroperoxidase family enzyme
MGELVEKMATTVYRRSILPAEEREVARMRIAQLNACNACATFRAPSVSASGVDESLYSDLADYETNDAYSERQRLAIEYAERFAADHSTIDEDMFCRIRRSFTDAEILDLTMCVAVYLGLGRALAVLGIDDHTDMDV